MYFFFALNSSKYSAVSLDLTSSPSQPNNELIVSSNVLIVEDKYRRLLSIIFLVDNLLLSYDN